MAQNRRLAPVYGGLSPRPHRQRGYTTRSRRFRLSTSPPCTPGGPLTGFCDSTPAVPLHPLWTDPLFDSEEYQRFAARVELSDRRGHTRRAEVLAGPRRRGETETRSRDF